MEKQLMSQFWHAIESAKTIAIGGHKKPDGDCVGSSIGLYNYITENYPDKEVKCYLGEYAKEFEILEGLANACTCVDEKSFKEAIHSAPTYDLFIALDTSNTERLEFFKIFEAARDKILADHHITNERYARLNLVFESSSAAEACYDLIAFREDKEFPLLSKPVADAIYLGIIHDTGVFKHSNTTRHTMEIAGALLECGVSSSKMIDGTFYHKTYTQNLILARVLLESELYFDGKVITGVVPREYLDLYNASKPDLEGIVDQLRITEGVEAAIFAYETEGEGNYKYSMRSNDIVDVSKIAVKFGGGGHVRAAGCTIEGSAKEGLALLIDEIKKQL
ncbi:MAG: bifunctional oligoribonuclease/PAP phosphatase NrnA [Lachnospiraceae bacterium]|nr:bifunctional oligoribonuclease/PAP phosphatase NrnA [Lachnospiraceae bacterium]